MYSAGCRLNILVVLFFLFFFVQASAAQDNGGIIDVLPAETLFCVRINNFDYSIGQLDQFLMGASPLPMGVSMAARMGLAQITANPQLTGIDMSGHFGAFGIPLPAEDKPTTGGPNFFIGFLIPVTGYDELVSASPSIQPADDKGISKITSATPPFEKDPDKPRISEQIGLAARVGSFALVSENTDFKKMSAALKMLSLPTGKKLSSVLDAHEKQLSQQKSIWAYANIAAAGKIFGADIAAELKQAKRTLTELKPQQGINPAAIFDIYLDFVQRFLNQTKSVSITIEPKPELLRASAVLTAAADTDFARMFAAATAVSGQNKLLGYLEDGAAANFTYNLKAPLWKNLSLELVDLLAKTGSTPQETTQMKKIAEDVFSSVKAPMAVTGSVDGTKRPFFSFKQIAELKDPATFNNVVERLPALVNTGPVARLYAKMGINTRMSLNRAVETYRGVPIDSIRFEIKPVDANSMEAAMTKQMYGVGLDYRMAVADNSFVLTTGPDADSAVRQLIDLVKAGGPKQTPSEIKAALELLPDAQNADIFGTYNLVRVFSMTTALLPVPVQIPQIPVTSTTNLAFAAKAGGGKLALDVAVPKQHLTEMMAIFQLMMMQQMQQQHTPAAPQIPIPPLR